MPNPDPKELEIDQIREARQADKIELVDGEGENAVYVLKDVEGNEIDRGTLVQLDKRGKEAEKQD